jgi:DNA-binding CsgD family transcriptional regulator
LDPQDLPRFVLSPRQREVLILAARGMTWRQIALALEIAPSTIRGHLSRARERLDAHNTTHAVAKAVAAGVIHPFEEEAGDVV